VFRGYCPDYHFDTISKPTYDEETAGPDCQALGARFYAYAKPVDGTTPMLCMWKVYHGATVDFFCTTSVEEANGAFLNYAYEPGSGMIPRWIFLNGFLMAMAGTAHADPAPTAHVYREGETVPSGYRIESRPRWGYIALGAVDFAGFYGLTLAAAADDHFENQKGWLVLPAVGPIITAFARDDRHDQVPLFGFLVFDGLIQGFSLGFLLHEALNPPQWVVPGESSTARIVPYFGRDGAGFQLTRAF
jgi:hypothetical protein